MRYSVALLALSGLIPFVASTYVNSGSGNCKKTEFWWKDKQCCLPHGGIPSPPSPPKGNYCPPTGYYWHSKQGCCVPQHPPPDHGPEPQCPKDCKWYPALYKCLPVPKPSPTHTPKPSTTPTPTKPCRYNDYGNGKCSDDGKGHDGKGHDGKGRDEKGHDGKDYGGNKNGNDHSGKDNGKNYGGDKDGNRKNSHWRRSTRISRSRLSLCPSGLVACPISGLTKREYECLDTLVELGSCGGCVSDNKGQDCNAIQGARSVGCEEGHCAVYSCETGLRPSYNRQSCVPV